MDWEPSVVLSEAWWEGSMRFSARDGLSHCQAQSECSEHGSKGQTEREEYVFTFSVRCTEHLPGVVFAVLSIFIFGHVGSSLLFAGFLSSCGAQASQCSGLSC